MLTSPLFDIVLTHSRESRISSCLLLLLLYERVHDEQWELWPRSIEVSAAGSCSTRSQMLCLEFHHVQPGPARFSSIDGWLFEKFYLISKLDFSRVRLNLTSQRVCMPRAVRSSPRGTDSQRPS
jgi:hypothetical protein